MNGASFDGVTEVLAWDPDPCDVVLRALHFPHGIP